MDEQNEIELTSGGYKKLGNLIEFKDQTIANAIKERGGGQGQVNKLRSDYHNLKVGTLASQSRRRW